MLATFPLLGGVPHADKFFHLAFFVVLISVAVQGTTPTFVARILGLTEEAHPHKHALSDAVQAGEVAKLEEVVIGANSKIKGRRVIDINLPEGVLLVLLNRGGVPLFLEEIRCF